MKNVLAVICGVVAAMVIFFLFEYISHSAHPFPKNLDMKNSVAMNEYLSSIPFYVFVVVLAGYAVGSFVAGFIIGKMSGSPNRALPLIAGILFTVGAIINLVSIPHPIWFSVVNLLIYIPLVLAGHSTAMKNLPTTS
jgi:hypothetical protein